MSTELLLDFESIKHINDQQNVYWSARELSRKLGYEHNWRGFEQVINKAQIVCHDRGDLVETHFCLTEKEVRQGRGTRKIVDYLLGEYALRLVVLMADLTKPEVAALLSYFAIIPADRSTAIKLGSCIHKPLVVRVERRTIEQIISSFRHLSSIEQYCVGNYRVDLYFPEYRIAVECDEHDHRDYDRRREQERQLYIERTLRCTFVRYNPCARDFNIGDVIHRIMMQVYGQGRQTMQDQSYELNSTKQTKGQYELTESAQIFRDVLVEARIASENITDAEQYKTIYTEVTDIVQHTVETIRNSPPPDISVARELRAEIERRNHGLAVPDRHESNL